ncbi:MAG: hypothetical protein HQK54_17335 [Oligoflexales bacterium]|nr:hypothetical protein [Oligoflexales bacterium]
MIMETVHATARKEKLYDNTGIIIGTSTAGIWPGKLLADKIGKPFVIINKEGKAQRELNGFEKILNYYQKNVSGRGPETIISSCPDAISIGIRLANEEGLPFGYIRSNPKNHGDKVGIEGGIKDTTAFLLYSDHTDVRQLMSVAKENGVHIMDSFHIHNTSIPLSIDISGKKALVIEDLISTGQSGLSAVTAARKLGAIVENELSIFTYDFPMSKTMANDQGVSLYSALNGREIINSAAMQGLISQSNQETLNDFFSSPIKWAERNGF